jgi:shikimate dehydrogenase
MSENPSRDRKRFLTGLIGAPIAQSASPAMHERAADALGVRCHYQLIEVAGADAAGLRVLLEGVKNFGFAGVNVTFPYKEAVVPLLDELSDGARAIGAVNTVVVRGGKLIGHNTDTSGFERAIGNLVTASGRGPVALIGAGGVGKAIAFALANLGVAELGIFDSDPAKAAQLAAQLQGRLRLRIAASVADAMQGAVGVINGTPVGMLPDRNSPIPAALLHRDLWVADAVYSPLWTPLLIAAKASGAEVMTGRELAIYQAADAFELFTGLRPSTTEMGSAFDAVLASRAARGV